MAQRKQVRYCPIRNLFFVWDKDLKKEVAWSNSFIQAKVLASQLELF